MARRTVHRDPDVAEPLRPRTLVGPLLIWLGLLLTGLGIARTAIRTWSDVWSAMVRTGGGLADWQIRGIWNLPEVVPEARRAMLLADLGTRFTRTWRGPDDPASLLRDVQQQASRDPLASMPAARLYEIAACLLLAERNPQQRDAARARALAIVAQLDQQPLNHDLLAAVTILASSLHSIVVQYTGGTIRDAEHLALLELGQPHGPLVEYLAPRLARLARELDAAGDHATATRVRRLVYHWLSSWLRDPGPPALRVLAADVLADVLESDPAFGASDKLIGDLRTLRPAYRDEVEHRTPPPERIPGSPQWRRHATRRLISQLSLAVWTGSVTTMAGLIGTLLTLVALPRATARPPKALTRRNIALAAGCALLLWLAGWVALASGWIHLPDALPDTATTRKAMTPVALWAAAATLLLIGGWAAMLRPPRPARLAHATLWLAITAAVLFQASALRLSRAWPGLESQTTVAGDSPLARLPGPRSFRIIESLPEDLPPH